MRNKKIIAVVCALSMIFSLFAGITAFADTQNGLIIENTKQTTKKEADITVKYNADLFPEGVTGANIVLSLPSGATVDEKTGFTKPLDGTYTPNVSVDGQVTINWYTGEAVAPEDNVITVITVKFPEMTENFDATLLDNSEITNVDTGASYKVPATLTAAKAVIKADPNAAEPTAPPTPIDKPTVDDTAEKPTGGKTEVVPDPVKGGIALSAAKTATGADVTVKYEGFEDGITGANIVLSLPSGATVDEKTGFTKPLDGTYTPNVSVDGQVTINWYTGEAVAPEDKVITVISVVYPEGGLAEDFTANLLANSELTNVDTGASLKVPATLNATTVTLPASVEDNRETVALKDKITPDEVKTAVDNATDKANTYLAIDVTKDNGGDVTYGDDYEAYYNGVKLTEAQLNNLLAGAYANDPENPITLEDVAKGLTFKYNNGVNIKMQLVADGEVAAEETTDDGGDEPAGPTPKPGDKSADGKIASNVSKSLKSTDSKQTATFTTTAAKDKDGVAIDDNDKVAVSINIKKTSYDAITGAGIEVAYQAAKAADDEEVAVAATATTETKYIYPGIAQAGTDVDIPVSADGKYVVSFTPAAKGTVEYTMTYIDANGKKSTATAKYTISAASTEKSGGSGSGSTSSGGGAIATGLVDTTVGYLPGLGFADMADASWASEAVNALAAKKIVSGVGDNNFDPNGALTRAAYAQMLVNAIGHSQDSADTEFADVPTDAWFYHNVAVAAQLGIVSGYGDGNFGPYDLITREQMALMTQKAAKVMAVSLVGADAGTFTDDADIADWSRDAVYELANAGIINGMGDGTFAPKANATRAQAAVIIYNTFVK